MKIKYIDGTVKDTDSMNDIQAVLAEKSQELVELCLKYKIPYLFRWYNPSDKSVGGSFNVNQNPEHFLRVIDSINHFFEVDLNCNFRVVNFPDENEKEY